MRSEKERPAPSRPEATSGKSRASMHLHELRGRVGLLSFEGPPGQYSQPGILAHHAIRSPGMRSSEQREDPVERTPPAPAHRLALPQAGHMLPMKVDRRLSP